MAPVLGTVQGQAYEAHLFFLVLGWSGAGAELSGACPARCPSLPPALTMDSRPSLIFWSLSTGISGLPAFLALG